MQREKRGVDDAETLAVMNNLAAAYFLLGRDSEAELLLNELVPLRQKNTPDGWSTFYAESLLGGILSRKNDYTAAEPLLLSGCEGLITRQTQNPARTNVVIPEALQRLIDFYEATGNPAEAAAWQTKRDAFEPAVVE